jgi:flagellar hook-basal body complex protein FliE
MNTGGIDSSRIEAMLVQLRTAASAASSRPAGLESPIKTQTANAAPQVNFAQALKSQLDSVADLQNKSAKLEKDFQLGDDTVSLSDVLISGQKAGIAFQTTLQVRNRLVSAYRDIMNMQV